MRGRHVVVAFAFAVLANLVAEYLWHRYGGHLDED